MSDKERLLGEEDHIHIQDEREDATSKRRIRLCIGSSIALVLFMLFLFTIIVCIIAPIAFSIINQNIAQNILNSANIVFHSMNLSNPGYESWVVTSNVTMYQTGSIPGTVAPANLTASYLGQPFAIMQVPQITMLDNNHPLTFVQVANMSIFNYAVYQAQAAQVIAGNSIDLFFEGNLTVTAVQLGLTMNFDVYLAKVVKIPAGKTNNITAYNVVAVSGSNTTLTNVVSQSLDNTGIIAVTGMGTVYLETWTLDGKYKIGDCIINDFHMDRGLNNDDGITSTMVKTPENQHIIDQIMSNYAMGIDTQMRIKGPVKTDPARPFLYGVSDLVVTLQGNPVNQLILNVSLGGNSSLNPIENIYNPLALAAVQKDVVFSVKQYPINGKYTAFDYNVIVKKGSCPASENLGYLSHKNATTLYPNSVGQIDLISISHSIPCEALMSVATCCRLVDQNPDPDQPPYFLTSTLGTFEVAIENFTLTQTYSQDGFRTYCVGGSDYWGPQCKQMKITYCEQDQIGATCGGGLPGNSEDIDLE